MQCPGVICQILCFTESHDPSGPRGVSIWKQSTRTGNTKSTTRCRSARACLWRTRGALRLLEALDAPCRSSILCSKIVMWKGHLVNTLDFVDSTKCKILFCYIFVSILSHSSWFYVFNRNSCFPPLNYNIHFIESTYLFKNYLEYNPICSLIGQNL